MLKKKLRKKRAKPLLTLEQWCEDFSIKAAEDLYWLFEDQQETVGEENRLQMIATFLAGFISATVYRSLAVCPVQLKSEQDKYEYALNSFSDIKGRVQDAVSSGFTGGMKSWSGKTVDYYCQVKVMPDPINKENPC